MRQTVDQAAPEEARARKLLNDGYTPRSMYLVNGKPAIGIGISMRPGGNNLEFGQRLDAVGEQLRQQFPIGIDVVRVADQSSVVKDAIGSFVTALGQAILIVLAVSFLTLGFRAGLVVALSIPVVLSIVLMGMDYMQIGLQREYRSEPWS